MKADLISKKDLLRLTGISYGEFYRLRRRNIIPKEWFIKKSSQRGDEIYFPKEMLLERIEIMEGIKPLKEEQTIRKLWKEGLLVSYWSSPFKGIDKHKNNVTREFANEYNYSNLFDFNSGHNNHVINEYMMSILQSNNVMLR